MTYRSHHSGYNNSGLLKFTRYLKRTLKPLSSIIRLSRASPPSVTTPTALPRFVVSTLRKRGHPPTCSSSRPLPLRSAPTKIPLSLAPPHKYPANDLLDITAAEACRLSLHRPSSVALQSVCALPPTSGHDGPPVHSSSTALAPAPHGARRRFVPAKLVHSCFILHTCIHHRRSDEGLPVYKPLLFYNTRPLCHQ